MIIIERLNYDNINDFEILEKKLIKQNSKYISFIKSYKSKNLIQKFFLRKKLYIAKSNKYIVGYVIISNVEENILSIDNIYISNVEFADEVLKKLLNTIKRRYILTYEGDISDNLQELMFNIGFVRSDGVIKLKNENIKAINKYNDLEQLKFVKFKKNVDEQIRCDIQNDVFKAKDRLPMTIYDVYYDERQQYYLENDSYFVKIEDQYIGYGQLIKDTEDEVLLVNFGVKEKFRGFGVGTKFLNFILCEAQKKGYKAINLNVKEDNKAAYDMYLKNGFVECGKVFKYTLI